MKTMRRKIFLLVWLSAAAGLVFSAELPDREEYAYRFSLKTHGDSEFFALDIPLQVYRSVSDSALRDAGIYNADGQPVPRIFEHPVPDDTGIEQQAALGLVPLYDRQADQPEQLRMLLHQHAGETTLALDSQAAPARDGEQKLTAYIVDLRELEHVLEALEFDWQLLPQGFIGTVRIEDSDDLRHWRKLGVSTLAELQYNETRIEQRRVSLERKVSDYLRISWKDLPEAWSLNALAGIYTEQGAPAAREWLNLDSTQPGETDREYLYDGGGYLPADRVNVVLPDDNVVVRASIFHRRNEQDRWRLAHNGIFYNITRQGNALRSPAAAVTFVRAGQWKIRIDSGMTTGPVQLQLGWRPDRLVFLAQGSPPFELITGRALDRLEQFPQETVLGDSAIFSMLRDSGEAGDATLGAREIIAGPDRLEIAKTKTWRVLLLWLGLSGAIALVGWLVLSLVRDMRRPG